MEEKDYADMVSKEDRAHRYETPYQFKKDELDSIKEIKRMLDKELYTDKSQAREHFLYLEKLENSLSTVLHAERLKGIVNEELPEHLKDISILIKRLKQAMNKL